MVSMGEKKFRINADILLMSIMSGFVLLVLSRCFVTTEEFSAVKVSAESTRIAQSA
jgi:hypothetical protein